MIPSLHHKVPFEFLSGLGIKNNFASVSHPDSNGLAEVTNQTILDGLKKKVEENKSEWPDLLDKILWTYRTTPREATQQSPYSLVYGMEVVTPMELVIPSLHITNYNVDSNSEERRCELEFVDSNNPIFVTDMGFRDNLGYIGKVLIGNHAFSRF
jgi:hypothetical protein